MEQTYARAVVWEERHGILPNAKGYAVDAVDWEGNRVNVCRHVSYQDAMETAYGISLMVEREVA